MQEQKLYVINLFEKEYTILISKKPIKSLRLKIDNNLNITLSIPKSCGWKIAEEFLLKKKNWLEQCIDKYSKKVPQPSCTFNNLSQIFLLGENKTLNISLARKNSFFIDGNILKITTKNTSCDYIRAKFLNWIKKYFHQLLLERVGYYYNKIFAPKGIQAQAINIKTLKTMWGNCKYKKNCITFNIYLIKADIECIDYVVLHELAHTIFPNHSADFKNFLSMYMPDWKVRKDRLNNTSLGF